MSATLWFEALRLLALVTVPIFSIIVLGVSAHITVVTEQVGINITFIILAGALAAKTLIVFGIMYFRRRGPPTIIIIEVGLLGLIWALWLAVAIYSAIQLFFVPIDCNFNYVVDIYYSFSCHEPHVVHAFSWMTWVILTGYWPFLFIMAIVQQSRGNSVWGKSSSKVDTFAPHAAAATRMSRPQQQQTVVYASQPMQQQPQMGYPPVPAQSGFAPTQSPQAGYVPPPMMYASQLVQQQPQMGYPPNVPGTTYPLVLTQSSQQQLQTGYYPNTPGQTYPPVPAQSGFAPTQSPQAGYAPQKPQQV